MDETNQSALWSELGLFDKTEAERQAEVMAQSIMTTDEVARELGIKL